MKINDIEKSILTEEIQRQIFCGLHPDEATVEMIKNIQNEIQKEFGEEFKKVLTEFSKPPVDKHYGYMWLMDIDMQQDWMHIDKFKEPSIEYLKKDRDFKWKMKFLKEFRKKCKELNEQPAETLSNMPEISKYTRWSTISSDTHLTIAANVIDDSIKSVSDNSHHLEDFIKYMIETFGLINGTVSKGKHLFDLAKPISTKFDIISREYQKNQNLLWIVPDNTKKFHDALINLSKELKTLFDVHELYGKYEPHIQIAGSYFNMNKSQKTNLVDIEKEHSKEAMYHEYYMVKEIKRNISRLIFMTLEKISKRIFKKYQMSDKKLTFSKMSIVLTGTKTYIPGLKAQDSDYSKYRKQRRQKHGVSDYVFPADLKDQVYSSNSDKEVFGKDIDSANSKYLTVSDYINNYAKEVDKKSYNFSNNSRSKIFIPNFTFLSDNTIPTVFKASYYIEPDPKNPNLPKNNFLKSRNLKPGVVWLPDAAYYRGIWVNCIRRKGIGDPESSKVYDTYGIGTILATKVPGLIPRDFNDYDWEPTGIRGIHYIAGQVFDAETSGDNIINLPKKDDYEKPWPSRNYTNKNSFRDYSYIELLIFNFYEGWERTQLKPRSKDEKGPTRPNEEGL